MLRSLTRALVTALGAAAVVVAGSGTAVALPGPCPGGEPVCVYLPPGTYTLGNPVSHSGGSGPTTLTVLNHCDTTTGQCDQLYVNIPGLTVASTPSTLLTLYVPGQGVALSGTTPTLYVGVPTVTPGGTSLGLTLNVRATTFVVWDTMLSGVDCLAQHVPPNPYVNGVYSPCGVNLTVTV